MEGFIEIVHEVDEVDQKVTEEEEKQSDHEVDEVDE